MIFDDIIRYHTYKLVDKRNPAPVEIHETLGHKLDTFCIRCRNGYINGPGIIAIN